MDNPVAVVTNQLSIGIDVFDVFNTSTDPKHPVYTYTLLGNVPAGETANINTKHFASQLQAMVSGKQSDLNGKYYKNFPVGVFAVSPLGELKHTVTKNDQASMVQAFRFIKYSSANGNSNTTKQFLGALQQKDNQGKAVDAFFASTGSFKQCTYKAWNAVMAYLSYFASPWQGSYYFYTQPTGQSQAVKLMAILSVPDGSGANSAPVMTMANSDNTIPKTGAQTIKLAPGADGSFNEARVGEDVSVSIKGVWINTPTTDPVTHNTRYLIGAVFSGTIAGTKVVGSGEMRELPKSQADKLSAQEAQRQEAEREKQFDRKWSKITSLVGLFSSLGMLFVMVLQMNMHKKSAKDKVENDAAKDDKIDKTEIDAEQQQIENSSSQEIETRVQPEIESVQTELAEAPKLETELTDAIRTNHTESVLDEQVEKLRETLESEPPTENLEQTAENLMDAQTKLADGDLDAADQVLEKTSSEVDAALEESGEHAAEYETEALNDVKDALEQREQVEEELERAEQERQEVADQDPSEDLDTDTFDDPMEDPIEDFPIGGGE